MVNKPDRMEILFAKAALLLHRNFAKRLKGWQGRSTYEMLNIRFLIKIPTKIHLKYPPIHFSQNDASR